jgi:hypothetical protein
MTRSLRSLAGKSLLRLSQRGLRLTSRLKGSFPRIFGLQVRGSLVQLYREDSDIATAVSFANYLSLFAPTAEIAIDVGIRVWDRNGRPIGRASRRVSAKQSFQVPLAEIIGRKPDEYGLFAIDASYAPSFHPDARFLGETTPQFMTLLIPTSDRGSPQMLHSHKELDPFPIPYSPNSRRSPMITDLRGVDRMDLFVLNSSPGALSCTILIRDYADDRVCESRTVSVPARGVHRLVIDPAAMAAKPASIALQFDFDRTTGHRKPILFRTFSNGTIVGNHT